MKRRYLAGACLALLVAGTGAIALHALGNQAVPAGAADPALLFYTKNRSGGFAAIDRWAFHGMKAGRFIKVLTTAGYRCESMARPENDGETGELRKIQCRKDERWPLDRTLIIEANVEPDAAGWLTEIQAHSDLTSGNQSFAATIARRLRKLNLMEPETLQVTGFQVANLETLQRMVADTLSNSEWYTVCLDEDFAKQFSAKCTQMANDRLKSGFPVISQSSLLAVSALDLHRAMERIYFEPVLKRGNDEMPEDALLIRLSDNHMWLDFAGKDLVGHHLTASIELESRGGTPINMVIGLDGESRTVPLKGKSRLTNGGSMRYLLPLAGNDEERYAVWLYLPDKNFPGTFDVLERYLPISDTAFIPPMTKVIIDGLATESLPEESLELYPTLRQIEQKAEVLQAMHPDRWLPREQGNGLVAQAYPDDPVIRAAWAFATCDLLGRSVSSDDSCVLRFVTADPDAAALVRSEIKEQQRLYAGLPDMHPLRMRLKRLDNAFSIDQHG